MASVHFSVSTCSSYSPTLIDMVTGLLRKILFGSELDRTHAWSQVSLAGPCTSSALNSCDNFGLLFSSLIIC
jgi:hypothetical protein